MAAAAIASGDPVRPTKRWPEILDVVGHDLRRVALGIEGNKDGDDLLGLGAELIESCRHHLELGGADVGAMGEAEKDEHVAAAEILIGDRLSGLIDEGEGAADQRLAAGLDARTRRAPGEDERGRASQRSDEEAGDDDGEEAAAHLFTQAAAACR